MGLIPFCPKRNSKYPFFTWGDANSLMILIFDVLGTFMSLVGGAAFDIPGILQLDADYSQAFREMVFGKICPGVAFALLWGNVWYAWLAHRLAAHEGREDVTALPYGLTTSGGIAVVFSVMVPAAFSVKFANFDGTNITISPQEYADQVWARGCTANFICGIIECCGALGWRYPGQMIELIQKHCLSKAALFCPLCGVGFCWLAMRPFVSANFHPVLFILPFALVFTGFYAEDGTGVYGKLPAAVAMVGIGTIFRWSGADRMSYEIPEGLADSIGQTGMFIGAGLSGFSELGSILPVVFPVAFANAVETFENVELAADAGDRYPVGETMLVDGCGTMLGAFCGSVFPTTVYMGHCRHKANGATAGYSFVNGVFYFLLLMIGAAQTINAIIDPISTGLILMAIGLMVVQHGFEVSVPRHYPAILIGLMVVLCDYMRVQVLFWTPDVMKFGSLNPEHMFLTAIKNVGAGSGILLSMFLTQLVCDLIDNYYSRACCYSLFLMFLSLFGFIHGNNKTDHNGETIEYSSATIAIMDPEKQNEGWRYTVAYAILFGFCLAHWVVQKFTKLIAPPICDGGVDTRRKPEWRRVSLSKAQVKPIDIPEPIKVETAKD